MDNKNSNNVIIRGSSNLIIYKKGAITNDYKMGYALGSGSMQSVRGAEHKQTGQKRAVKFLKKIDQDESKFLKEIETMSQLSHPNLMQIIEIYDDSKFFYVVSELCSGGELFDKIIERGIFSEAEAVSIISQILSALVYTHSNNIFHIDLNPESVLLDVVDDKFVVKILDFGGARYMQKHKKFRDLSTPYYLSPEFISDKLSEKSDVWSCGVILYIMLCGYPPFNGVNDIEIKNSILAGKLLFPDEEWSKISEDAKDLLRKMLTVNPANRLSAKECLEHPWFQSLGNSEFLENRRLTLSHIRKFQSSSKVQKEALSFVAKNVEVNNDQNKLHSELQSLDINKEGKVPKEELIKCLTNLHPDQEHGLHDKIKEFEDSESGKADYNILMSLLRSEANSNIDKSLSAIFKALDKENHGLIKCRDLVALFNLERLEEEKKKLISLLADLGEQINYDQFSVVMKKLA